MQIRILTLFDADPDVDLMQNRILIFFLCKCGFGFQK
jgi:hypothetical protein